MSDIDSLPFGRVPVDQLRVGDAERHQAAMALGEHFAAGRLNQEEFDERVGAAYAARTQRDLHRLFLDLPAPSVAPPQPAEPAAPVASRPSPPWFAIIVPIMILLAALAISVETEAPLFPFVVVALLLIRWQRRRARRAAHGYTHDAPVRTYHRCRW